MINNIINTIAIYATFIAQIAAVIIIVAGMGFAFFKYIINRVSNRMGYNAVLAGRLELGHTLSLGLSFLIGASILKSAISPSWDDIGKLAAIIALRTVMNYFLTREIRELQKISPDTIAKAGISDTNPDNIASEESI